MTDEILKCCEKCVVKTIINPSVFWMTSFTNSDKFHQKKLKNFEASLALEVRESKEQETKPDEMVIGLTVAVEVDGKFHRGLIIDIYHKNFKFAYDIILIDYGNIITADRSKISLIKNSQLREEELGTFKVVLHRIYPIILDINDINKFADGIFQKRISNVWATAAYNFVKCLLGSNMPVYVKPHFKDGFTLLGDIYLIRKPDGKAESLSELLCYMDFATFWKGSQKLTSRAKLQSGSNFEDILKKIPLTALSNRLKNYNSYVYSVSKENLTQNDSFSNENIASSSTQSSEDLSVISGWQSLNYLSSSCSYDKEIETKELTSLKKYYCPTPNLSSSLVLKKVSQRKSAPFSHQYLTFQPHDKGESVKDSASSTKPQQINIFSLLQRHREQIIKNQSSELQDWD